MKLASRLIQASPVAFEGKALDSFNSAKKLRVSTPLVNYPYAYTAGTLKRFLEMIPNTGTPSRIPQEYLNQMGFKSTNDRAIIPVLKFITLVDEGGNTTPDYKLLRNRSQFGAIIAQHIKIGYSELFESYLDANTQSNDRLRDFFAPKTDAGEKALGLIIATFKTLCEVSDFGAAP